MLLNVCARGTNRIQIHSKVYAKATPFSLLDYVTRRSEKIEIWKIKLVQGQISSVEISEMLKIDKFTCEPETMI